ncbi:hypothetical protein [Streptomyces daliensis]|uniref:Uncharacterized protein n=1 Tax=Streptomyces daliensis TaxID=299421 RepID=A0A8T4IWM3_9ACTN|nr:hypothetical protein [Streptomyces daliensis]
MGQDKTLARGARISGAVALAVLALLSLGWIIRDFVAATEVADVWWMWSGLPARAADGLWATSAVEPTLLVLYVVCAVTAVRSSASAGILAATGVLTVLLRVPSLWNLNADWMQGVDDALRDTALYSVIAMLVLGVVLVVIAAAGRRPVTVGYGQGYGNGYGTGYGYGAGDPGSGAEGPARPTRGGGVVAFLLLGGAAGVLAAWEIHWWLDQGWGLYHRALTGERALVTLLAVPSSWNSWALAVLALAAAVAAVAHATYARPLGMTVGAGVLGAGVFYVSYAVKMNLFDGFGELSVQERLRVGTAVFEVVAGLLVLGALAARAARDEEAPLRDYGPNTGFPSRGA